MFQYLIKIAQTSAVVVSVSEIAKRSIVAGAVIASLPLTSLLAFVWPYSETGDVHQIAALAQGIFWMVLASLPFFLILPTLLKSGWGFWPSTGVASIRGVITYAGMTYCLNRLGMTG